MSILNAAARLRPIQLKRDRRGYTLLEAVLVLALVSILTFGLGLMAVSMREQMWVSAQLQHVDQFANDYLNTWIRTVRAAREFDNGDNVYIRRQTAPIEMQVNYIHPKDYREMADKSKERTYLFKFNYRDRIPELRINGQRQWSAHPYPGYEYTQAFPPVNADHRDQFFAYPGGVNGFKLTKCTRPNLPNTFRDNYLTLEFTMVYRRNASSQWPFLRRLPFIKEMHYQASAYTVNPNWPVDYEVDFDLPDNG